MVKFLLLITTVLSVDNLIQLVYLCCAIDDRSLFSISFLCCDKHIFFVKYLFLYIKLHIRAYLTSIKITNIIEYARTDLIINITYAIRGSNLIG